MMGPQSELSRSTRVSVAVSVAPCVGDVLLAAMPRQKVVLPAAGSPQQDTSTHRMCGRHNLSHEVFRGRGTHKTDDLQIQQDVATMLSVVVTGKLEAPNTTAWHG